jgi:hypothetical protein
MPYFPDRKMPKFLREETVNEVDDCPLIYNARDYNTHVREIIAIEDLLGTGDDPADTTLIGVLRNTIQLLRLITNDGLFGEFTGTIKAGNVIEPPSCVTVTTTSGALATGDAVIAVASTEGFPSKGFLTKFNAIDGTTGAYNIGNKIFNSEIVSYTGKTDTTFTGCTREVAGTAQAVGASETAMIVSGRAALGFGFNFVGKAASTTMNKIVIGHDARLQTFARLYNNSTDVTDMVEVSYAMTVIGSFEDLDITRLLG